MSNRPKEPRSWREIELDLARFVPRVPPNFAIKHRFRPNPVTAPFGFWLKMYQLAHGISNADLARAAGLRPNALADIKSQIAVKEDTLAQIAKGLNLKKYELVDLLAASNRLYTEMHPAHIQDWHEFQQRHYRKYATFRLRHAKPAAHKRWGNGNIKGFDNYNGPSAKIEADLPTAAIIAIESYVVVNNATAPDLVRAAIEEYFYNHDVPVIWELD
jgi:transcriptional regulator with XRE-family HTH domain